MEQVHGGRRIRSGRTYTEIGHGAHPAFATGTATSAAISRPWHRSLIVAMADLAMALLGHKAIPANGTRRLKEAPT